MGEIFPPPPHPPQYLTSHFYKILYISFQTEYIVSIKEILFCMNEVFKTIGENFEYEYCNKVNLIPVLHMICIYIYTLRYIEAAHCLKRKGLDN